MSKKRAAREIANVARAGVWGLLLLPLVPLAGCATTAPAHHPQPKPEPTLTAAQRELNVKSFDMIWEAVRDRHWDPALGGVNWQAVYDEVRPEVAAATTMSAARATMQTALARLHQSHFNLIPGDVYEDMDAPDDPAHTNGEGDPGLTVRVVDGRTLVTAARSDGTAVKLGVEPGWEIVRIDHEVLEPVLKRIALAYADSTLQQMMLVGALEARLKGPVGSVVSIEFLDGQAHAVTLEVSRAAPEGRPVHFGHLPTMYLVFDSRRVDDNIGYIAFNVFLAPDVLMMQIEDALRQFAGADGIILDLRGNPGGLGAMSMGIAGLFVAHADRPLGEMHTRASTLKFAVFPRVKTYAGPLAILVDGCTASTAEILAGGLQDLGRARIFGTRTAGAALPAMLERLPNGDGFMHAIADYVSASGRRLEGEGVVPDVIVQPSRPELLAGRDPMVTAAIQWIHTQHKTAN